MLIRIREVGNNHLAKAILVLILGLVVLVAFVVDRLLLPLLLPHLAPPPPPPLPHLALPLPHPHPH